MLIAVAVEREDHADAVVTLVPARRRGRAARAAGVRRLRARCAAQLGGAEGVGQAAACAPRCGRCATHQTFSTASAGRKGRVPATGSARSKASLEQLFTAKERAVLAAARRAAGRRARKFILRMGGMDVGLRQCLFVFSLVFYELGSRSKVLVSRRVRQDDWCTSPRAGDERALLTWRTAVKLYPKSAGPASAHAPAPARATKRQPVPRHASRNVLGTYATARRTVRDRPRAFVKKPPARALCGKSYCGPPARADRPASPRTPRCRQRRSSPAPKSTLRETCAAGGEGLRIAPARAARTLSPDAAIGWRAYLARSPWICEMRLTLYFSCW